MTKLRGSDLSYFTPREGRSSFEGNDMNAAGLSESKRWLDPRLEDLPLPAGMIASLAALKDGRIPIGGRNR